jgi:hypothetical protein
MIRYLHSGEGRGQSKAFQRYPGGEPNNLDTGLRRYDAGRFNKRNRSISEILIF